MHIIEQEVSGPEDASRSGAPGAAPFLDNEGGNVPRARTPQWTKKHFATRRKVLDRLRLWQSNGYQCLWVTLTSAPGSTRKRLRQHFHVLRKRMDRELKFNSLEYVCVDTTEGNGVLHMIWAWKDPNPVKRASFYVEFGWLQNAWKEIHGAFHVNVKRIGGQDKDARRLSRYIVSQYVGDQDGLVRVSQSKPDLPLTRMRNALLREMRSMYEKYYLAQDLFKDVPNDEFGRVFGKWCWTEFRLARDHLLRMRHCRPFGVQFVWLNGSLERV